MRLAASASRTLVLLAPSLSAVPDVFPEVQPEPALHEELLAETQRFRGGVYLEDGAIKPSQLVDGRHRQDADAESWHLLILDDAGHVSGCLRYREYSAHVSYGELNLAHSALAGSCQWGATLREAVTGEMIFARQRGYPLSESGGWALHEDLRGTTEALRMALGAYALAQILGGGIGLTTATRRHGSASILRRMGGRPLDVRGAEIPAYYDPQYECEMEILRFYSWAPNPRYKIWIEEMKADLVATRVVTASRPGFDWARAFRGRHADFGVHAASA